MHLSEEIGARLQEERKRCSMTQNELAEALGIAKRTQANYEAGSSDATAAYLSKVATQFGFDVPYVLTGVRTTLSEDSLSHVEDGLVKQYRSIPDDDQKAVRRILKAMADDAARAKN
ncbi:helix-turn-helix transcriptional regulator [Pseudomonas sp. PS01297]|uniref:helix-turn-helix domain-containing protein n=1 Tax=Pseudomonas sp. PS01297 TaxID=2991433 RepID=UPI00249A50E3|nr:helix-turn-helix transcriptional regulator [Pseudomonas sp. PS01297]